MKILSLFFFVLPALALATDWDQPNGTFKLFADNGTFLSAGDPILSFRPFNGNIQFLGFHNSANQYFLVANSAALWTIDPTNFVIVTPNVVPNSTGSGSLGVSATRWGNGYINAITGTSYLGTTSAAITNSTGTAQLVADIPVNGGHGVYLSDDNGGGNAAKVEMISTDVNSGHGANTQTYELVSNGDETSEGGTDVVGQDFCMVDATVNPFGSGQHGSYRLCVQQTTGDIIVNSGLGSRNGTKDGVLKASDHLVADANPARNLTVRGGDNAAGTGDGGDLLVRGGTTTGGQAGDFFIPSVSGTPVDTPHTHSGFVPERYDTTNHKLCVYDGGWKCSAAFN